MFRTCALRLIPVLLLSLVVPNVLYGQEDEEQAGEDRTPDRQEERENRRRAEEARRREEEAQRRAVAERERLFRLAIPIVDAEERERVNRVMEVERRKSARENLIELAEHLQRLYDLATVPVLDGASRNEITRRSEDAIGTVDELLDFVNLGTDPPVPNLPTLPPMNNRNRMTRVVELFRGLYQPMDVFINGQILDLAMLQKARSDFTLMRTLLRAVPDSVPR